MVLFRINEWYYLSHLLKMPITMKKNFNLRANAKNKLKKAKQDSDSEESEILETESEESEEEEEEEEESEETSDSSYHPPTKRRNRVVQTDDEEDDEEDEKINKPAFRKLLADLFPSKYINKKVKADEAGQSKSKSKKSAKSKKSNKKVIEETESEYETVDEDEDDSEEEEEEEEERGQFIIIANGDEYGYDEDEDALEDDDDEECNSEDEQTFMKENYKKVDSVASFSSEVAAEPLCDKSHSKKSNKSNKKNKKEEEAADLGDAEAEYLELVEMKTKMMDQLRERPKNKILKRAVDDCRESIRKLVLKTRMKNVKMYHQLINNDQKNTGELEYFKKKLSNKEQLKIMRELKEINTHINIDKPYRLSLLESNLPPKFKAIVMQKLNVLRSMEPGDPEYYKIKNWVDTFMRVPFGRYKSLSVRMSDGVEACSQFMTGAKATLDNCVYGLEDAKMQIMQMMGQWITNPSAMGTSIAIRGPPGTGKTSLVKEGISKILGREFAFIALGGTGDSSFLEGHSYTYEGSSWGKIVQILIDSKCMNPVIYFDELDKVSDTPRGEEIIGILTHLTDTTQNNQYHDKYFSEIDFDLSKCLFIFSYNDESKVNPILKDRMYRIQTKGYDAKEKIIIARKYLLPKICEQVNFAEGDIIIPDETLNYIISSEFLTQGEAGVRNLKRCLEIIHTKLNLFRLVPAENNMFSKEINLSVTFPMTVNKKDVDVLIKNEEKQNQSLLAMYC